MTPSDVTHMAGASRPFSRMRSAMAGEHGAGLIDSLLLIGARVGTNLLVLVWTLILVQLLTPDLSGIAFAGIAVAQIASMFLTLNVEAVSMRVLVPAMREGRLEIAAGFIRFNRRILLLALPPVELKTLRLGVVPDFWANMDADVAPLIAFGCHAAGQVVAALEEARARMPGEEIRLPEYVDDAIADIALIFHWPLDTLTALPLPDLITWRERARVRACPDE